MKYERQKRVNLIHFRCSDADRNRSAGQGNEYVGSVFGRPDVHDHDVRVRSARNALAVNVDCGLAVFCRSAAVAAGHVLAFLRLALFLAENRCVKAFDVGGLHSLAVAAEVEGDRVVGPDK